MNRPIRPPGHSISYDAAAHDEKGKLIGTRYGRGRCSCRALSEPLPSKAARQRWHRKHREEIAGVPWSDRAMTERYR